MALNIWKAADFLSNLLSANLDLPATLVTLDLSALNVAVSPCLAV
jgi:hypothetical protein